MPCVRPAAAEELQFCSARFGEYHCPHAACEAGGTNVFTSSLQLLAQRVMPTPSRRRPKSSTAWSLVDFHFSCMIACRVFLCCRRWLRHNRWFDRRYDKFLGGSRSLDLGSYFVFQRSGSQVPGMRFLASSVSSLRKIRRTQWLWGWALFCTLSSRALQSACGVSMPQFKFLE